jgi:hypothetical protein
MADKFIKLINGRPTEFEGVDTSAGAGDAGKIPALNSSGKLDSTLLPSGVGAETLSIPSFENLTAGNFVNIFLDGGVAKARKADAATAGKEANGFVLANVTAPANATVYAQGLNNALSGLTIGEDYYLSSTTPGAAQATSPTGAGVVSQHLGRSFNATTIGFTGHGLGVVQA